MGMRSRSLSIAPLMDYTVSLLPGEGMDSDSLEKCLLGAGCLLTFCCPFRQTSLWSDIPECFVLLRMYHDWHLPLSSQLPLSIKGDLQY